MSPQSQVVPATNLLRKGGNPSRAPIARSIALGITGAIEVILVFLLVRDRLPSEVTDHFGLNGVANGSLPPGALLGVELGQIGVLSAVFLAIVWLSGRSATLTHQVGSRLTKALLIMQGAVVVGLIPLLSGLLFASSAGELSVTGSALGLLTLSIGLVPLVALFAVLHFRNREALQKWSPSQSGTAPAPAFLGVGRPIELTCSSCGQLFRLSGVPLFAPHMAVGLHGSFYVRCPLCGERGWDALVARVST